MGTKDWVLLVGGAALGFFISIVANLMTPLFGSYFEKSKTVWLERSRERALKKYRYILRFRDGTEDKYMYFVAQWGYIVMLCVVGACSSILSNLSFNHQYLDFLGILLSVTSLTLAWWTHRKLFLWYKRMNNFENYTASLKKKWPDFPLN